MAMAGIALIVISGIAIVVMARRRSDGEAA
jgi:hypothetical protein